MTSHMNDHEPFAQVYHIGGTPIMPHINKLDRNADWAAATMIEKTESGKHWTTVSVAKTLEENQSLRFGSTRASTDQEASSNEVVDLADEEVTSQQNFKAKTDEGKTDVASLLNINDDETVILSTDVVDVAADEPYATPQWESALNVPMPSLGSKLPYQQTDLLLLSFALLVYRRSINDEGESFSWGFSKLPYVPPESSVLSEDIKLIDFFDSESDAIFTVLHKLSVLRQKLDSPSPNCGSIVHMAAETRMILKGIRVSNNLA